MAGVFSRTSVPLAATAASNVTERLIKRKLSLWLEPLEGSTAAMIYPICPDETVDLTYAPITSRAWSNITLQAFCDVQLIHTEDGYTADGSKDFAGAHAFTQESAFHDAPNALAL